MKNQISQLVNGSTHLGGAGVAGTSHLVRQKISEIVIAENPDKMTIKIMGHIIELRANYSLSRKSVNYSGVLPLDVYKHLFGEFGLPQNNPTAYISISGDMVVTASTNSKKFISNYIDNNLIEII